ncbi:MAG: hypothetical protein ABI743_14390, partial [bacterium]
MAQGSRSILRLLLVAALVLGLRMPLHSASLNPPDPANLQEQLAPLTRLILDRLDPAATRVLAERDGTIYLEPVSHVLTGDQLAIYPEGTVVAGPEQTSPLPPPLMTVTVDSVTDEAIACHNIAPTDQPPPPLPSFAPARRPAVITGFVFQHPGELDSDDGTYQDGTDLGVVIGPLLEASTGLVMVDEGSQEHTLQIEIWRTHEGLVVALGDESGLLARCITEFPFDQGPPLPVSIWSTPPDAEVRVDPVEAGTRYWLPRPVADAVWSPLEPNLLLCLTEAGIMRYRFEGGSLNASGETAVDFPFTPPYSPLPTGRLGYWQGQNGPELWAHLGRGSHGFALQTAGSGLEVGAPVSGIPITADDGSALLLVQPSNTPPARYTLVGASLEFVAGTDFTPLSGPSIAVRDVAISRDAVTLITDNGTLQRWSSDGTRQWEIVDLNFTRLWSDGATVIASRGDGRLMRFEINAL